MPLYHQKLNLPDHPLAAGMIDLSYQLGKTNGYGAVTTDVDAWIDYDLMQMFEQIGIRPQWIVHFKGPDIGNVPAEFANSSLFHSDVVWHNNSWTKVPAAINWEIGDCDSEITWWDASNIKSHLIAPPPTDPTDPQQIFDKSIHHGGLYNRDTSQCTLLETLSMPGNSAYLINPSVPHKVTWNNRNPVRTSISLRFSIDDIPDWDTALRLFADYF